MSIVRPILWAVAAMLFAAFAIANWTSVPLTFGATQLDIKLPALLLIVALLVWLPASLRVRLARRRVSALTAAAAVPPPASVPLVSHPSALDQAQPTIVPPGYG